MIKEIKLINLGTINKNKVNIITDKGMFALFFSYETIVGFDYEIADRGITTKFPVQQVWRKRGVIENLWSTTTGKLLNEIEPDKKKRMKEDQFISEISKMFDFINR